MKGSRGQSTHTFSKAERLSSKVAIEHLFASKLGVKAFPLRIIYTPISEKETTDGLPQVLISVPKRKFKSAVDRNLLKRRIREAYRLNKNLLQNIGIASLGIIYVSDQTVSFKLIEDKLILAFHRLSKELNP